MRITDMRTKKFKALAAISASMGENNDCTVKAVAMYCNVRYTVAHKTLADLGRKKGRGCTMSLVTQAIMLLTDKAVNMSCEYIKGHRTPNTYAKLTKGKRRLVVVRGHVIYMQDGVIHDHDQCNARRIEGVIG
jgi:hypothetical protein